MFLVFSSVACIRFYNVPQNHTCCLECMCHQIDWQKIAIQYLKSLINFEFGWRLSLINFFQTKCSLCSSAEHGREKKRGILVAETTRELRSPIQPCFCIAWNFLQNHVQPFLRKFAHLLSCYAAFHLLYWPWISTLAQLSIMAANSSFVQLMFIGFLFRSCQ